MPAQLPGRVQARDRAGLSGDPGRARWSLLWLPNEAGGDVASSAIDNLDQRRRRRSVERGSSQA